MMEAGREVALQAAMRDLVPNPDHYVTMEWGSGFEYGADWQEGQDRERIDSLTALVATLRDACAWLVPIAKLGPPRLQPAVDVRTAEIEASLAAVGVDAQEGQG